MKTRFLLLLAAMLLGTASAFAQSGNNEPLKGDVNEDGTVDVADITAIIKIMKDGGGTSEETAYYWVGTTQPTASNISSLTPKYSSLSDMNGKTLSVSAGQTVYLVCKTGSLSETSRKKGNLVMPDQSRTKFNKDIDTTTISGHSIYHSDAAGTAQTFTFDFDEELQTVYYSYVGTDTTGKLVDPATGALKSDIATQIKTISGVKTYTSIPSSLPTDITITAGGNYVYVIAPTTTLNNATIYLVNLSNMNVSTETLGTFSIGSTEYTVKCTPSEVGTIKTAWK